MALPPGTASIVLASSFEVGGSRAGKMLADSKAFCDLPESARIAKTLGNKELEQRRVYA
jgi:hypothetical protein